MKAQEKDGGMTAATRERMRDTLLGRKGQT